jgi:hypothetical protein
VSFMAREGAGRGARAADASAAALGDVGRMASLMRRSGVFMRILVIALLFSASFSSVSSSQSKGLKHEWAVSAWCHHRITAPC